MSCTFQSTSAIADQVADILVEENSSAVPHVVINSILNNSEHFFIEDEKVYQNGVELFTENADFSESLNGMPVVTLNECYISFAQRDRSTHRHCRRPPQRPDAICLSQFHIR